MPFLRSDGSSVKGDEHGGTVRLPPQCTGGNFLHRGINVKIWRRYRSAGVRVSRSVHRIIQAADAARSVGEWRLAATLYEQALGARPDLYHIQIQLGHARRQSGDNDGAERAYRQAAFLFPAGRDATLHLGHLLKETGNFNAAASLYADLVHADPDDQEAMREARDLLGRVDEPLQREMADRMLARLDADVIGVRRSPSPGVACDIVFDASGLLTYFSITRRPTGIQRVQSEALNEILTRAATADGTVGLCCFVDGRDEWVAVPFDAFLELTALSVSEDGGSDLAWRRVRDRLHLRLYTDEAIRFASGALLVNLGTSWSLPNYFLTIRNAQRRFGITYIPLIYDLIPTLFPNFCIETLVQDFSNWLSGIFDHTQSFLAISEATKRDLISVAANLGYIIPADLVEVVRLDASFSSDLDHDVNPAAVNRQDPFVLFVSTIEPRKGHLFAFEAWRQLLHRRGNARTPQLICVGQNGWRNATVFAWLGAHPEVAGKITILSGISDAKLRHLYARCLFTIYPSLYEGWGLPVTESLVHGKAVVTTTSSSLPEAGGSFAAYVPPADADTLAAAVERWLLDEAARRQAEERIREEFEPRTWRAVAEEIIVKAKRVSQATRNALPTLAVAMPAKAEPERFHWLGRSYAAQVQPSMKSGEIFRCGLGWSAPLAWGSRVRDKGGTIEFRIPADVALASGAVDVTVRLVGSERAPCGYEATTGMARLAGILAPREHASITISAIVDADRLVSVLIAGSTSMARSMRAAWTDVDAYGSDQASEAIGVIGFSYTPVLEESRVAAKPDESL